VEVDNFICVLVLAKLLKHALVLKHEFCTIGALWQPAISYCPHQHWFMFLLATRDSNFLGFYVVLFVSLYFDTDVSDEN
jgi:hypothetical protein